MACAATALALPALPALARDEDDGEFAILHARYGTPERNADVTGRLRELARSDRRFRLTNDLFGIDPDPGRVKALRLFVRDRQGRERSFDFREHDWIHGAQFIGWGGGRWGEADWPHGWHGSERREDRRDDRREDQREDRREDRHDDGEFTILYATYGTPYRSADVTERLRELARRDQRFRMGNDTFGVDPDPGRFKQLRIVARDRGGRERTFEYPENAIVDGAQFVGWGRGDWGHEDGPARPGRLFIDSASYGAGGRMVDVTQALRAMVRGERFEAEVSNELFGVDPALGQRKALTVSYRLGNGPMLTLRAYENEFIRLP